MDDELQEAVNRSNGMQSFLSQRGHEMWVKDVETLVNRALTRSAKVDGLLDALEKIKVLRKRADDAKGFVDGVYPRALNVAVELAESAIQCFNEGNR